MRNAVAGALQAGEPTPTGDSSANTEGAAAGDAEPLSFAYVQNEINEAGDPPSLGIAAGLILRVPDEKQRNELEAAARAKATELGK